MHISCPNCSTKFTIRDNQIGNAGRKVKCSKCSHTWNYKTRKMDKIDPLITSESAQSENLKNIHLPAILPAKTISFCGTPLLLMGMIIFMILTLFPNILGINNIFNRTNLIIQNVQIMQDKKLNKFSIHYRLLNPTNKEITIPHIRLRLYNGSNELIKSKIDDYGNITLKPLQYADIKGDFTETFNNVTNIDITLGNKLDFMLE